MFKIVFRYFFYRLFASHRRGFGIHSPFVFHLVSQVLNKQDDENLKRIAFWRKDLLHLRSLLQTSDNGAGSKVHKRPGRSIGQIERKSSIRHKYGRVLYSFVKEFKPATIIELGTGIGISTAYLAKACPECRVITIEADQGKMKFASNVLEQIGLENITFLTGFFRELLSDALREVNHPLLVFVDGDHSYYRTIEYFTEIKKSANSETIIILDDIRWSEDMEKAWNEIKKDKVVIVTMDLFFMGIVFFRRGIPKQDFIINF